jgi:hypothetical protein
MCLCVDVHVLVCVYVCACVCCAYSVRAHANLNDKSEGRPFLSGFLFSTLTHTAEHVLLMQYNLAHKRMHCV